MLTSLRERLTSLKATLMLIVLCCWLLPTLILGVFMGARLSSSLREKTDAAVLSDAKQTWTLLDNSIAKAVMLAKDATYDGELSKAQSGYQDGTLRYQEYFSSVRSYLDRKYIRESLFAFALYFTPDKPEEINYTTQGYTSAALFQQNAQKQALADCETLDTGCLFLESEEQMYLIRNLYDTQLERFGILVLGVNRDALLAPALRASPDGLLTYAVLLDGVEAGAYVTTDQVNLLEERGESLLYTQTASSYDYTLTLQARANKHEAYAQQETLLRLTILMIGLIVPLCVLVMLYAQWRIVKPISQLAQASKRIEDGELGLEISVRGARELTQLAKAFSHMSARIKRLIDKSYKELIALRDARILALQSRINPHFINNALEDVNWQARIDGSETTADMVETLSVLLNASLDRSEKHLVPLSEELRVADAYFYFIGLRFGDRLSVITRVEESVDQGALVPRLVVQVLVENAVEHGISPAGGGRILLHVFREGHTLMIEVHNDGRPLTQSELSAMERLMREDEPAQGHIGIRNVSQRLKLLFGDGAGLRFFIGDDGQTVARIHLPYTLPIDERRE